MSLY
ncbi:c7965983-4cde-453d-af1e-6a457c76a3f4 [Thermothielavioides terrestris]|jgi:MFS family permease